MPTKKFNGSVVTKLFPLGILLLVFGVMSFALFCFLVSNYSFGSEIDRDEIIFLSGFIILFFMCLECFFVGGVAVFLLSPGKVNKTYIEIGEQKIVVYTLLKKTVEIDYAHLKQPTILSGWTPQIKFENTYGIKCRFFVKDNQAAVEILQTIEEYKKASKQPQD